MLSIFNQGQSVVVYDVFPEAMAKLESLGAQIAHNPAEVADKSDTIVSMLPNSQHVMEVYAGDKGVME